MSALTVKQAIEQLEKCPPDLQLIDESMENVIALLDKGAFVEVRTSPLPQLEGDVEE